MSGFITQITPADLGFPPRYKSWRKTQAEAIDDILDTEMEFHLAQAPVGIGKTGIGVGAALADGGRMIYVTRTNLLLNQLVTDFSEIGLALVKGRANYACMMGGTCEDNKYTCQLQRCAVHGLGCTPKECDGYGGSCDAKRAYFKAMRSKLVATNYAYLIRANRWRTGLGECDLLILDEGHLAHEEVASALQFDLKPSDCALLGVEAPRHSDTLDVAIWEGWSRKAAEALAGDRSQITSRIQKRYPRSVEAKRALTSLMDRVDFLNNLYGRWIVQRGRDDWEFHPVWPREHSHKYLFAGAAKTVVMSATATNKSMALLGLKRSLFSAKKYPYAFPKQNFPAYHVKGVRVGRSLLEEKNADKLEKWLDLIYRILKRRTDRKGIIHSVSYAWRERIVDYIESRDAEMGRRICSPAYGREVAQTAADFKQAPSGAILIGPSYTTGYDFPGNECEFIIIAKIPFVPTQSRLMQARLADDEFYDGYLMMQELVQASGRGSRSADDRCEVFLLDDNWHWIRYRYKAFKPAWFTPRSVSSPPSPPPTLAKLRDRERRKRGREDAVA